MHAYFYPKRLVNSHNHFAKQIRKEKTMHELSLDMNLAKAQNDFSRPVFISHVAV